LEFSGIPGITMGFWNSIGKSWDYRTMRNFNYFPLDYFFANSLGEI
jgi:hypothetical protein